MKINVKIFYNGVKKTVREIEEDSTYEDLLNSLNINPETVLLIRNGIPIAFDEKVTSDDLEILRVVSGG